MLNYLSVSHCHTHEFILCWKIVFKLFQIELIILLDIVLFSYALVLFLDLLYRLLLRLYVLRCECIW